MGLVIQRDLAKLDEKRVLAYFKKPVGESVTVVRTEHEYLLADKVVCVRLPMATPLAPFTFPDAWTRASFPSLKEPPVEGGLDWEDKWQEWAACAVYGEPELTHELLEVPVAGHYHPGILYRKFTVEGHGPWYYDKRLLDLFSPDVVDLSDFLFEQVDHRGLMRVSARYGYVAYLMPMQFK